MSESGDIVEINVGGVRYATTIATLAKDGDSWLAKYFANVDETSTDDASDVNSSAYATVYKVDKSTYFIDRDGALFRYVLDYLRTGKLMLPENFREYNRLRDEAKFYRLNELAKLVKAPVYASPGALSLPVSPRRGSYTAGAGAQQSLFNGAATATPSSGYITVGYRGTFAFGRDGQADVKFRKLTRILVCGRAGLCKEVFGDTLNESRDPDRGGENRYTSRLFLKHVSLEWAFDTLGEHGFGLLSSAASGTCGNGGNDTARSGGADGEEQRWNHYNEFVFYRPSRFNDARSSS